MAVLVGRFDLLHQTLLKIFVFHYLTCCLVAMMTSFRTVSERGIDPRVIIPNLRQNV
jgi:hypothetical protein